MNQKSFVITSILREQTALSVIATPLSFAQDMNGEDPGTGDTITTSTHQDVKQKNTGSDDSVNSNCGQNLYKARVEEQECDLED